jgi:hypothetical protein
MLVWIGTPLFLLGAVMMVRGWVYTLSPDGVMAQKRKKVNLKRGFTTDMKVFGRKVRRLGLMIMLVGAVVLGWYRSQIVDEALTGTAASGAVVDKPITVEVNGIANYNDSVAVRHVLEGIVGQPAVQQRSVADGKAIYTVTAPWAPLHDGLQQKPATEQGHTILVDTADVGPAVISLHLQKAPTTAPTPTVAPTQP